jgi:hypothetical protein
VGTELLHDLSVDQYLAQSVTVEPLQLEEEFVRLPADLAYWHARAADALREYQMSKLEQDKTEANLRIVVREHIIATGGKPTESQVESGVMLRPEYSEARARTIEAEVEYQRLRGVCEAVRVKRDALVALGQQARAEMSDPVVRQQVADRKVGLLSR